MQIRILAYCWLLMTVGVSVTAHAQEVTLSYRGLTLNAELEPAPAESVLDHVIVITHGGLGHRAMETVAYLQRLFGAQGYATLALNLSLGVDNRHGMFDCHSTHRHQFADAAGEIGAWLRWLSEQGVRHVILLGHSRGAGQTALYAATQDSGLVQSVVLLAPDTRETNDAAAYEARHQHALAPVLQHAQRLMRAGKGASLLTHTGILYCSDTTVSAASFVSYYGPDPRLDTAYLIPKIKKPVLLVLAGGDEVVAGSRDKFPPLADGVRVQVSIVDGADHFFRDIFADDAVEFVIDFLKRVSLTAQ